MRIASFAAAALLVFPAALGAAEPAQLSAPRLTLDAAATAAPFSAGTNYLTLGASYLGGVEAHTNENFYTGAIGLALYPFNNLGLLVEIPASGIQQDGPDTAAIGLNLLLRWHFFSNDKFTFYADGGAGFALSRHPVPEGGTWFNFIEKGGLGFTYELAPHWFLDAGARVAHLSNAGLRGSDRNPSINLGVEGYAGVMFQF